MHAGTDISQKLGLSRTAVWKALQRLKSFGVRVNAVHSGYSLEEPLILLNKNRILQETAAYPYDLDVFETIDSTNTYLMNENQERSTQVCISEFQTAGKGRRGRKWHSPFGQNIYMSLSRSFTKDISELSGIGLVMGIALAKTLEAYDSALIPKLKWPNDLFLGGKKLGGVLIELFGESNGSCRVIIGIGLNVNMTDKVSAEIDQDWISLEQILKRKIDRNILVSKMISSIFDTIALYEQHGFDLFLPEWQKYDFLLDKEIALERHQGIEKGICRGINKAGQILLESSLGDIQSFSAGDTQLLKK